MELYYGVDVVYACRESWLSIISLAPFYVPVVLREAIKKLNWKKGAKNALFVVLPKIILLSKQTVHIY